MQKLLILTFHVHFRASNSCAMRYQHDPNTDEREGALVMAHWEDGLQRHRSIPSPGVYDVAWSSQGSLACACADGALRLYDRDQDLGGCKLTETILIHLCWLSEAELVTVGQDGFLRELRVESYEVVLELKQHELEAWCVECSGPHLILTGADDGLLLGYDLRGEQAFKNRSHEAGVTALALNPLDDQQLVSGSYDERLRIFDLRMMREPVLRSERLGDGAYQVSDSDSSDAT